MCIVFVHLRILLEPTLREVEALNRTEVATV